MWLQEFRTGLLRNRAHATTHHRPVISVVTKEGIPRTLPVLLSRIHAQHAGRIFLVLYGWDTGFLGENIKRHVTCAEVCWYLPKTREQWRLQGTACFVCNATASYNNSTEKSKEFWENEVQQVAENASLLQRCVQLLGAPTQLCPEAIQRPSSLKRLHSKGMSNVIQHNGAQPSPMLHESQPADKKQLLQGLCAFVCLVTEAECLYLKSPQKRTCWTYQHTSAVPSDLSHAFMLDDVSLSSLQTNLPADNDEQCPFILHELVSGVQGDECSNYWDCAELNP